MSIATVILATIASIVSLTALAACVELLESLRQLQERIGLDDSPRAIDLPSAIGEKASDFGLPKHGSSASYVVLFVSPVCETCYTIVSRFRGKVPQGVDLVVTATTPEIGRGFLAEFDLSDDAAFVDSDRSLVDELGISSTPSALVVEDDLITKCLTVPSHRALLDLVDQSETILS